MLVSSSRRVALAFLAHPDDAEILCAGTLILLAEAGWEIHIATVAQGDCGSPSLPAHEIAAIRRQEGVASAALIGARYHCLDEQDLRVVCDKSTINKALGLFREVAPTLVFTHPRHDYMLDHEQVHLLARAASFGYAAPNCSSLPVVAGSCVPWLYYCDPVEGVDPYTGVAAAPTTYVDVSASMTLKAEMLACHRSQREWLQVHHGMDDYIESMKRHSAGRGREIDAPFAEAFVQHRGHPYPASDLLAGDLLTDNPLAKTGELAKEPRHGAAAE
jgi:LmbE family N-acetylglucosaminyl deacetylase